MFMYIAPPWCSYSLGSLWEKLYTHANFFDSPTTLFLVFSN